MGERKVADPNKRVQPQFRSMMNDDLATGRGRYTGINRRTKSKRE